MSLNEHLETAIKSILQLKRTQGRALNPNPNPNPTPNPALLRPTPSSAPGSPPAPQRSGKPLLLPPDYGQPLLADTDSVLEAAVNSILEC